MTQPTIPPAGVASPCISVCKLNTKTGFCEGCYRNRDEIRSWGAMDSNDRLALLAVLRDRRQAQNPNVRARRVTRRSAQR